MRDADVSLRPADVLDNHPSPWADAVGEPPPFEVDDDSDPDARIPYALTALGEREP